MREKLHLSSRSKRFETGPERSPGIESIMFDPLVVGIQHGPYSIDPGIESSLIDKRDRLGSRVDLYANAQDEMEQLQRKKVISSLGSLVLGHFSDIRFT